MLSGGPVLAANTALTSDSNPGFGWKILPSTRTANAYYGAHKFVLNATVVLYDDSPSGFCISGKKDQFANIIVAFTDRWTFAGCGYDGQYRAVVETGALRMVSPDVASPPGWNYDFWFLRTGQVSHDEMPLVEVNGNEFADLVIELEKKDVQVHMVFHSKFP
jgi:hypothetical protein